MTVVAQIQALATVESTTNKIDTLAVLDRQIKEMTATTKAIKDQIANELGEGKHRGEKYGVRVTIENRKGSIDMEALLAHFGITAEQAEQFRGATSAIIKVTPTA